MRRFDELRWWEQLLVAALAFGLAWALRALIVANGWAHWQR